MKYTTVLMDADGTLLDFLRSEREAVREALCEIGVDADDSMLSEYSRINDGLWKSLERGEIEKSVLVYRRFEIFFQQYGIDADAHDMAKRYMRTLSDKGYILDGAYELCQRLSEKHRLFIVTNGIRSIQSGRMEKSGLLPFFEDYFISDDIGFEKPSVRFFEYVEKHIRGFDKSRTVIVGDSLTSDIRGGVDFGIDTCWYSQQGRELPEVLMGKVSFVAVNHRQIYEFISQGEEDDT